jgi:hypothetical protein
LLISRFTQSISPQNIPGDTRTCRAVFIAPRRSMRNETFSNVRLS